MKKTPPLRWQEWVSGVGVIVAVLGLLLAIATVVRWIFQANKAMGVSAGLVVFGLVSWFVGWLFED